MEGVGNTRSWRWIFILEGLGGVLVSALAYFVIPGFPQEAKFLTPDEKEFLLQRLENERGKENTSLKGINWFKALTNWKIWML